jgi:flagellar biosynthesis chaperone FliJ
VAVANQNLQSQVGTLTTQVAQQQQEVSTLSQDIRSGFQNLEALFAKKQRRDE